MRWLVVFIPIPLMVFSFFWFSARIAIGISGEAGQVYFDNVLVADFDNSNESVVVFVKRKIAGQYELKIFLDNETFIIPVDLYGAISPSLILEKKEYGGTSFEKYKVNAQ